MENLSIIFKKSGSHSFFTAYYDDNQWNGNNPIGEQAGTIHPESESNPGCAIYNNWLYLVYKGVSSDKFYVAWFDGETWHGNSAINRQLGEINPESISSPSIAVYQGNLFIVYRGVDSEGFYSAWFDGNQWFGNKPLKEQNGKINPESNYNPTLVVYNDKLYVIYKGANSDYLYTAWYDGNSWQGNKRIEDQNGSISPESNQTPGAAVFNDKLYIFYKGKNKSDIYTAWFDGDKWEGDIKIEDQGNPISPKSDYGPHGQVFENKLYLFYSNSGTDQIYSAYYDGSGWFGNTAIEQQPGNLDIKSESAPGVVSAEITPRNQARWMQALSDSILISEINIPGSHDAAAIISTFHTPYVCHNYSITKQLEYGIRLLDVRIKVYDNNDVYSFDTCHGDVGDNAFQSLPSLLDECRNFLTANPSEMIIMSLKIDDWNGVDKKKYKSSVVNSLAQLLDQYPISTAKDIPTMGGVRGKIFLYNRITDNLQLGAPIDWHDNTSGSNSYDSDDRHYNVYVQDKYEDLSTLNPHDEKLELFINAFSHKNDGMVVWNFASATYFVLEKININSRIINYFGEKSSDNRIKNFGWTLFNYGLSYYKTDNYGDINIVSLIIDSNFGYPNYPSKFKVN